MSLEQAITDHALALRELAAAIRSTIGGANEMMTATDKVIADAKKTAVKETPKADVKKPEVKKEEPAAEVAGLVYDDVKKKVLAMAQAKGRDTLVTLLQRHGVKAAPELKETQYVPFVADIDAIMAGTYDPELADAAELA